MLYHFGEYMQKVEFGEDGKRGLLVFYNEDHDRIQHRDPHLTAAHLRDKGVRVQGFVII